MIKLAKPDILEEDFKLVKSVLDSGHLVQGKYVKEFEENLNNYIGCSFSKLVSSGTAALHICGMAIDVRPGDNILVSAFTYPASANAFEVMGANIDILDVCPDTYCSSYEILKKKLIKKNDYKALVIVHEFGNPIDMQDIYSLCKEYNIIVIEDAACALGSIDSSGNHVGKFSDYCCFSFHPRKAITTGEGGLVTTNSSDAYAKICSLVNHGTVQEDGKIKFKYAGLNYRMTDFQAVLGLSQLSRYNSALVKRRKLGILYQELLSDCEKVSLPNTPKGSSYQTFMVVLNDEIDRNKLIAFLRSQNIESNIGAYSISALDFYKDKYKFSDKLTPIANRLYNRGLALPLHAFMTEDDVRYVVKVFREYLCM